MADLKCGQQGYKGPKCKVKDYDRCDELQAGAKLTELFPDKSKQYQQNKLNYIDNQTRKDSFWLVNNEDDGVCWNDAWYLYELPEQVVPSQAQPVAKEKDLFEETEGLFEDVGDFFDRTIKGYQRKVEKVKEEGVGPQSIVGNFWKEITGTLGAIALLITVKVLRSKAKKKKAAEAMEKGRVSDKWELGKREPVDPRPEPTLGSQRFADEAPVLLTERKTPTPTPTPIPASVTEALEEPVFDLTRPSPVPSEPPPSESPVSELPGKERATIGIDFSAPQCEQPPADPFVQDRQTVAGDYSAQTVQMSAENGQPEISQGSRPTVEVRAASSGLPPKAESPELSDTGRWKISAEVLNEPDLIIAEALHDFDPPGSLTYEDLEVQGFDLGEEEMKLSPLLSHEKEYGIEMPERTLKRAAIIAYEEIFSRSDIADYDKILDTLVVLSFEKATKNNEKVVELDHVVEAAMQYLDVEGEQDRAGFRAEVEKDLKGCKLWINRKGYETTAWKSKHISQSNGNGHSTNGVSSSGVRKTSESGGVRVGMPGEEPSIAGFKNTPEGGIEIPDHLRSSLGPGTKIGAGKDRSTTMDTAQVTPDMLAQALDATVNRYPNFPQFRSREYWKLAREAIGEFVVKDPGFSRVWGAAEERIAEIKVAFTTVLNESTETVAQRFFNRQEGATHAGAKAATSKALSFGNGTSKPFYIPGLDKIPAVTELYNEADVEVMVDRAMDMDAELRGLQSFERAEYKADVMTAMKEIPGFEADYVKDGKITVEGVKAAVELCGKKKGLSGSGTKAAAKVEFTEDRTKAEEFKFEDMFTEDEKRDLFDDPVEIGKKK